MKNLQHFPETLQQAIMQSQHEIRSFGRHFCFSDFRQRALKKSLSTRVTNQPIRQKSPLLGQVALGDKTFVSSAKFQEKFCFNKFLLQNFC